MKSRFCMETPIDYFQRCRRKAFPVPPPDFDIVFYNWWFKLAELKFFGYLADLVGTRGKEVNLEKPIPLREMLTSPFPEMNIIILINEKVGSLDSSIKNGDSVVLMPILSGG